MEPDDLIQRLKQAKDPHEVAGKDCAACHSPGMFGPGRWKWEHHYIGHQKGLDLYTIKLTCTTCGYVTDSRPYNCPTRGK